MSGLVTNPTTSILHVNTTDTEGGAARVARNLLAAYRVRGYLSWLAVGRRTNDDPNVFTIPHELDWIYRRSGYSALQVGLSKLAQTFPGSGWGLLSRSLRLLTHPRTLVATYRGIEDFDFPGTYHLLKLPPQVPGILHCHNLHGGYFDLRSLSWLSRQVPVVVTLHDAWLLSGHCAHSLDCERWKAGCGGCPYLSIDPPVWRDATAENWERKRRMFAGSCFYISTPCQWLMQKVSQSILAPATAEARVIPNGVDLSIFQPTEKLALRESMGISQSISLVLFDASNIHQSSWKDFKTLRNAISLIAERLDKKVLFIGLGGTASPEQIGQTEVRFIRYEKDPKLVARYYQAADLYVHAARADTFPNTVLEALACGTPVIATAVGGIPEQVKGLDLSDSGIPPLALNRYRLSEATGILVPPDDAESIAEGAITLLKVNTLRAHLADNAVNDARERFDLDRQVEAYLEWYKTINERWYSQGSTFSDAAFDQVPYA